MSKCLYCLNEVDGTDSWHETCVKKFFGVKKLPEIDIDFNSFEKLALPIVNSPYATVSDYLFCPVRRKKSCAPL